MKEIEVKAKITDKESLEENLADLGCIFSELLVQDDRVFLPNGIEFSNKTKEIPAVRVRNSNGIITLTLKKRASGDNELINLEKEVVVSNQKEAIDLVELMGFHEVVRVSKMRRECKYNQMTLCIDDVANLGNFIEVEKLSEDENMEEIQNDLFNFLQSLGIDSNDRVVKGYDTMMYEKMG